MVLELLLSSSKDVCDCLQEGSKSQMDSYCPTLEQTFCLYHYIVQDFHCFGNDTEAFKYIDDKQTYKTVANLLNRANGKPMY